MAKSKKTKSYKPKAVKIPKIINSRDTFEPFEQALKDVVQGGEIEVDQHNIAVYKDAAGIYQSFESGLLTYLYLIQVYAEEKKMVVNTTPFSKLRASLVTADELDEKDINETIALCSLCRQILATTPHDKIVKYMTEVRIRINELRTNELAKKHEAAGAIEELYEKEIKDV